MANKSTNPGDPASNRQSEAAEQIEEILNEVVRKHPRLREAREAVLRSDEPGDKFAREFLQVFRQRLQGS